MILLIREPRERSQAMPYRVEQTKRNDFAVLYCWRGDETNVAVIFAYQDRSEAEAEAEHLNQRTDG
jgi:hypothetical protein